MDAAAGWAVGLTVAGALSEGAGIWITVTEIRDRSRKLRSYETRIRSARGYAIALSGSLSITGKAVEVEPPTVEKRLDRIENQIDVEIPKRIAAAEREAVEQAQKRMEEHVRFMIDGVRGDLGEVTNLLTGSLGGASRALRGVAALVVGLALQMIGSVVSTILQ